MPRGPAPAWRARKQPVTDDYLLASVSRAGGLGKHHPGTGHYSELVIRGLDTKEEAAEWKRSLHRCAYFLHKNGIADISVKTKIERDGKKYAIRFTAINKAHVYRFMIERYGEDRSLWPYDPRRRQGGA
jgi:hypothetical protein